jgi:hypothetical protein
MSDVNKIRRPGGNETERQAPGARLEGAPGDARGKRAARCWEITLSAATDAALTVVAI